MTDIKKKCEDVADLIRLYADEVEESDADDFYKVSAILRSVPALADALENSDCVLADSAIRRNDRSRTSIANAMQSLRKAIGEDDD